MLRIKLERSYTSPRGNRVFVYSVAGTTEELASFETAQGDNHRTDKDTQKPLWFTTRCVGETGSLIITANGKVVPDMSAFDMAASLASQYGGNLGAELARASAEKLVGVRGSAKPQQTPADQPQGKGGIDTF